MAFHCLNLVRPLKRLIDVFNNFWNAIYRVEALVGIHVAAGIGVRCNLPTGEIDCFQASLDLLNCLVAGESAERWHKIFPVQQFP